MSCHDRFFWGACAPARCSGARRPPPRPNKRIIGQDPIVPQKSRLEPYKKKITGSNEIKVVFLTNQRVWNIFLFLETELWQRLMLSMHSLRLSQMMLIILHFVRFWRGNRTKVFTINVFFLMSWWWQIIIGSNWWKPFSFQFTFRLQLLFVRREIGLLLAIDRRVLHSSATQLILILHKNFLRNYC